MTPREKILREGLESIAKFHQVDDQYLTPKDASEMGWIARETLTKADAAPRDDPRYLGFAHAEGFISWALSSDKQAYSGPLWTGPEHKDGCTWAPDEWDDSWNGSCGAKWVFPDAGPSENKMRFCPECGRPLTLTEPLK